MAKRKKKRADAGTTQEYDYTLYTDGGCVVNPGGSGGYGVVVIDNKTGEVKTFSGGFKSTTNNRMEIMAAIVAMEAIPVGTTAVLHSDSQYFLNCFNGVWQRKKNTDLFELADAAERGKKISFEWVRGHVGNTYNEMCDAMATAAMNGPDLQEDPGYVPEAPSTAPAERAEEKPGGGAMAVEIKIPHKFKTRVDDVDKTRFAEEHAIKEDCAKGILQICAAERQRFTAYVSLKTGGIDSWSKKSLDELIDVIPDGRAVYNTVREFFPYERDVLSALRWRARGLPLEYAMRKVLVDKEVAANHIRGKGFGN